MSQIIACTHCGTKYKVDPARFSSPNPKIRCKKCEEVFVAQFDSPDTPAPEAPSPPPAAAPQPQATAAPSTPTLNGPQPDLSGKQVVIAIEDDAARQEATDVLTAIGLEVIAVGDGIQAFVRIADGKPAAAVLSVTLPKMYGFEICEILRRDSTYEGTKILLLAQIFDEDRYKRNPSQLYGADDFVERQEVKSQLASRVAALIRGETPAPRQTAGVSGDASGASSSTGAAPAAPAAATPTTPAVAAAPSPSPTPTPESRVPATPPAPTPTPAAAPPAPAAVAEDDPALAGLDQSVVKRAQRLARIIVSDIALYNEAAIKLGVKGGDYMSALTNDLNEARRHFDDKISEEVASAKDFIKEALDALIERKRQEG